MSSHHTSERVPIRSVPTFLFAKAGAIIFLILFTGLTLCAQTTASSKANSLAALEVESTNAWQRVLEIVNRPVAAYRQSPGMPVATLKEGWFHEGAFKPDFNTVDVRQSQEFPYANNRYITSVLNPGIVFPGAELEFNAMLKIFYTNRSLPKRRLTEAEMNEINNLYRVIGRYEDEFTRLSAPRSSNQAKAVKAKEDAADTPVPGQSFERIRSIPRGTRIFFGSIAIVFLLVILVVRAVKK